MFAGAPVRVVTFDVEVDGEHFHVRCFEDVMRDRYLGQRGWTVLRFWALEVRDRPQHCVERVVHVLKRARVGARRTAQRDDAN